MPSSGDPPDPGIEPRSPVVPALQGGSLLLSHRGSPLGSWDPQLITRAQGLACSREGPGRSLPGPPGTPDPPHPLVHPRAPHGAQALGSLLKGPSLSAPTRLDTDLLPRDGGSVTPGWLLGTQHTAPEPLGSSLGCRLLTASRGQGPPGAAVSAPLSRPPQVGCWGPPAGGHPGLPLRLRPPPPPALRDGVSLSTTALRTVPGDIVCVSRGMRVMREHSTPKASPLRGARPQLPSPTCAWLGPAGDQ